MINWVSHGSYTTHSLESCLLDLAPILLTLLSDPPHDPNGPEAPIDGWNNEDGDYSFLYSLEGAASAGSTLLLKCLAVDGTLLVNLLILPPPDGARSGSAPASQAGTKPPETVQLGIENHAVPEIAGGSLDVALSPGHYGRLQALVDAVHEAIESQV